MFIINSVGLCLKTKGHFARFLISDLYKIEKLISRINIVKRVEQVKKGLKWLVVGNISSKESAY